MLENHLKETPCSPPKHVDLAGGTSLQEAFHWHPFWLSKVTDVDVGDWMRTKSEVSLFINLFHKGSSWEIQRLQWQGEKKKKKKKQANNFFQRQVGLHWISTNLLPFKARQSLKQQIILGVRCQFTVLFPTTVALDYSLSVQTTYEFSVIFVFCSGAQVL